MHFQWHWAEKKDSARWGPDQSYVNSRTSTANYFLSLIGASCSAKVPPGGSKRNHWFPPPLGSGVMINLLGENMDCVLRIVSLTQGLLQLFIELMIRQVRSLRGATVAKVLQTAGFSRHHCNLEHEITNPNRGDSIRWWQHTIIITAHARYADNDHGLFVTLCLPSPCVHTTATRHTIKRLQETAHQWVRRKYGMVWCLLPVCCAPCHKTLSRVAKRPVVCVSHSKTYH